jgi:hypothetical protein
VSIWLERHRLTRAGEADQGQLTHGHQGSLPSLSGEHFQVAHGLRPALIRRSLGLDPVAGGRRQQIDLVLHGEHLSVYPISRSTSRITPITVIAAPAKRVTALAAAGRVPSTIRAPVPTAP